MNEIQADRLDSKTPIIAAVIAASLTIALPFQLTFSMYFGLGLIWLWTAWPYFFSVLFNDVSLIFLIPGCFRFLFVYKYYLYFRGSYSFENLVRIGLIVHVLSFSYWLIIIRGLIFPTPFMVGLCLLLAKIVREPRSTILAQDNSR